jgi:ABC-2 type transport system ATP-binding protein
MFERGVTVLFVSHSIEQIRRICDRAIILDKGVLIADGPVEEICNVYEKEYIGELAAKKPKKKKKKKKIPEIKEEETIKSEKEEIPETGE